MKIPLNPLTMRGHLKRCWLFSYRTPPDYVRPLLPAPLEPVTFGGWAFWNVVVCEVTALRPSPMPAWFGLAYWHVGYRLHVRVRLKNGGILEGLHFLRSDADRRLVALAGNFLTDFNFHPAHISISDEEGQVNGRVVSKGGNAEFCLDRRAEISLAPDSPFRSPRGAVEALKYKPFGISVLDDGRLNVVRVVRRESAWRSTAIGVANAYWEFFRDRPVALEACVEVDPIDYEWRRREIVEGAT